MSRRTLLMVVLLVVALPSGLYAIGMGEMGGMMGMGGFVDEVNMQTKNVGKVVFSHSTHGAMCTACHPQIFQKKSNSNNVGMKAMEKGQSCGACHNGKKTFSVAGNCATCHAGDILYKEEDIGDVSFSHTAHIEMFGCDECHPGLFKAQRGTNRASMSDMEKGASCGACHDGSAAFGVAESCDSCHQM
jgi:c(7)-type cytochrome triheme protein